MVYPATMESLSLNFQVPRSNGLAIVAIWSHEFSGHSSEILVIHRQFLPYILIYMIGFCVLLVIPLYQDFSNQSSSVIDQWIRWQVDPLTDVFSWLHLTTSWPLLITFHYVQGKSFRTSDFKLSLHDIQDSEAALLWLLGLWGQVHKTLGTLRLNSYDLLGHASWCFHMCQDHLGDGSICFHLCQDDLGPG